MGVGVLEACVWQALAGQGAAERGAELQGVRSAVPVVVLDMRVVLLRCGFRVGAALLTGLLQCSGMACDTFGRLRIRTGALGVGGICSRMRAVSSVTRWGYTSRAVVKRPVFGVAGVDWVG